MNKQTPEYLIPLLDPFPISSDILDEIEQLCCKSNDLSNFDINDNNISFDNSCYESCQSFLDYINISEESYRIYKRSNRTPTSVTIGNRRLQQNENNESQTNISKEDLSYQQLTTNINNFINGIKQETKTLRNNDLTKSFPLRRVRQRAQTTSQIVKPSYEDLGLFQLKAMQKREGKRCKHLSVTLEELVDESPQEKLLRVFAKHKRASARIDNAWKEYMNSVSSETQLKQTRKSIRYGTRKSMNSFLKKRKSIIGDVFVNPTNTNKQKNDNKNKDKYRTLQFTSQGLIDPIIKTPRAGIHVMNTKNNNTTNNNKNTSQLPYISRQNKEESTIISVFKPKTNNTPNNSKPSSIPQNISKTTHSGSVPNIRHSKRNIPPMKRMNSHLDNLMQHTKNIPSSQKRRLTVNCQEKEDTQKFHTLIKKINENKDNVTNSKTNPKIELRNKRRSRTNIPISVPSDMRGESKDNDVWREQLRMAWESEITTMPSVKQKWYKNVESPNSPGIRQKLRQKKYGDSREYKSKDKVLKILLKYKLTLEKEFLSCGQAIRSLRLKEKAHRISAKTELAKIKTYYNTKLLISYRKMVVSNLLSIRVQISYEDKKSLIINESLKKTRQLITMIQGMKANTTIPSLSAKHFASVESLCSTPIMTALREDIKVRQRTSKKYQREHQNFAKGQGTFLSQESRQQRLLRVIHQLRPHPIINTYHEYTDETQNIIDSILLDQRCRSGMKILRLWEAIEATAIDEIPPHEIVDFLQDFVDQTALEFSVPDDYLDRLRLCVGRSVYPVLFNFLWNFNSLDNEQSDIIFEKQQQWLRTISPENIDPVLAVFKDKTELFDEGINILEGLSFHIIPADMLMILYQTMEHIHNMGRNSIGGDLGADDLFPIWLYITIHSDIPRLHSHLCYMEHFATPEESMTQLGYCLTTFQACVAHISSIEKSKFNI